MSTLPLAAASVRLRGRAAQSRSQSRRVEQPRKSVPQKANLRTLLRPQVCETSDQASSSVTISPRLLGVRDAGHYLGVSPFTVRNMVKDKRLLAVHVPGLARILIDIHDLDALIEGWKVK